MGWLIWLLAIWFVMRVVSRGTCSPGYWNAYERRRIRAARAGHWHLDRYGPPWQESLERRGRRRAARSPGARKAVEPPKETPEERIRRRFVEGRIDLDQYEAELWEELRPK